MASSFGLFGFIVVPETSAPVLLQRRAKKVHYETRNWAIHPQMDERQVDLKGIAERYLARPIVMLIKEPILVLITLYMGLIYGMRRIQPKVKRRITLTLHRNPVSVL